MTEALADLLVEKGIFSADELRAQMEQQDTRAPIFGAKLIARAWKDEAFKARLIADVNGAADEMDLNCGPYCSVVIPRRSSFPSTVTRSITSAAKTYSQIARARMNSIRFI